MLSNPFQSFLKRLHHSQGRQRTVKGKTRRRLRSARAQFQCGNFGAAAETLEDRVLLAAAAIATPTFIVAGRLTQPGSKISPPTLAPGLTSNYDHIEVSAQNAGVAPIDPAQMEAAYGVNQISFGGVKGTGAGQTIAIVDAYNNPYIISDANTFSSQFGLPTFNVSGGPTLQVLNQNGGTSLAGVPNSSPGDWDVEESLDVQWAHSIAPQANIILFEANSNSFSDLLTAEQTAAGTAGVSTVSNSWGAGEFAGENSYDSYFLTPANHQGVTFLASTGDSGTPAGYPAYSPNVVAVGGTTLVLNSAGTYQAESAWAGGGGGVSTQESQPAYQTGKVNGTSSTGRTAPDISLDADPNTGVFVLDSLFGGWLQVGGTSLSSPMMAGVIAIADQGRALNGLPTLDGPSQTLPLLYDLSSANLHDITTGNDGNPATPGYDLATGLGTPIANDLVPALAGYQSSQPATISAPLSASLIENGSYTFTGSISATDASSSGTSDSLSLSVIDGTLTLKSTTGLTFVTGSSGTSSMTVTGTLANLNAAINGLRYTPASGYSGVDFLQVSLKDANDSQTGWASINITVNPLTPPVIVAPSAAAVFENQVFVFGNASINVGDAFAAGTSDSVSLSVTSGTLALDSTTGLTFAPGTTNATSSMTFSGTLGNLNAALNGLVYTPNSGFTGPDVLVISAKDSGDNLSGSATVAITVGTITPPSIAAPTSASLNANSSYAFPLNSVSVSDIAAFGTSDSLTLSAGQGTLTLGSISGLSFIVGSNDSSSMTVNGTLANLNAALNGLVYTPTVDYSGSDSLVITVRNSTDNLGGSAAVTLTIAALGLPVITAPSQQVLNEGVSVTFLPATDNSISFSDSGASGTSDSLTLSVSDGTLTLGSTAGLVLSGNGSSSVTATGTVANLNAALNGLVYTPNAGYMGSDALHISVADSGDNKSASATVALMIAGWTSLTNQVANNQTDDGVNLTLLLPNGDLLAHGAGDGGYSTNWYELTPDSSGGYVNGTWTQVASMNVGRLYFGSAVLPNGNVFVVGGEYSSDNGGGFSDSAETYNPATNTWKMDMPDPQPYVGDEEAMVLPNGNVLVGNVLNNGTEIYNPTTDTWTAGGNKIYSQDTSDEESWVKLPNGDILAYDIFASIDQNKFLAELYNPATNSWSDASNGSNLQLLSTPDTGYELGPALLLPDGDALFTGTEGQTAFYNPNTNSWKMGPTMPVVNIDGVQTQLTTGDAPGAVLPDGDVVLALSPPVEGNDGDGDEYFPPPTYIYDFNPITGVFKDISPSPNQYYMNYNSFIDDMLVLPTGQLLMTDFGTDPVVLTPGGNPNPAWAPTITAFTNNNTGSYTLTGTQLNGLDEGAAYGDDNQMDTNFPIVQVTDDLNGNVYYATTSNWSSTWVQTGSTPESVNVVMPSQLGNDPYSLVVIANGIASTPYYSNGGPPVVTAPPSANVTENVAFTFKGNAISVADLGASGSDSLTLLVGDGKLALGSTAGLTVSGNNSASVTATGSLANLNAALDNLVYTPNSGYVGPDSLQISLKDSGDNLSATAAVGITVSVETPPDVTAPAAVALTENNPYTFPAGAIGVTDTSASGTSDSMSLSVSDGTLTLGSTTGLTITGSNGSSSMTVTGTLSNLNAALSGLDYSPGTGYTGGDSLQISVTDSNDSLTGRANVSITVSQSPSPKVSAPLTEIVGENSLLTFANGSINLTDPDASGTSDSLTISAAAGTLTLGSTAGLTFSSGSNGSSSMTVTGTLSNLNLAVSGLQYRPRAGYSGSDSLQIGIKDSLNSLSGSAMVAITVDAPPAIAAPLNISLAENTTYSFAAGAISLADAAATSTSESLTLSVAQGIITLGSTTGLTFTTGSSGSSSITMTGTLANLNAAVSGLIYTPNTGYYGADSLQIALNDSGDRLAGSSTVGITVNPLAPPSVSAPSLVALVENGSYTFSAGAFSLTDAAASGASDSLSLSVADGKLTLASTTGLTVSGSNGSSSMTVTGTLANLSAALSGLVYVPTAGFSGSDALQLTLKDSVDNLQGVATVTLNVAPLAAPTIAAPQTASLAENASFTFGKGAIVVTDADAIGSTTDSISLSVSDGKLTLGSTSGLTISGANGSSSMTVTGTLSNLNAALNGLVYTPVSAFSGHDSLAISVKDLGDSLTGSTAVAIAVDPFIAAPPAASLAENGALTFSSGNSNAITLTDGAAAGTSDSLSLSVTNGKLALGSTSGITVSSGSNNSSSMTITGTLANLNAALQGLKFTPTSGYAGSASLALTLSDSGDNLSGTANVALTVNPAITVSAPASEKVLENSSWTFSTGGSDPITAIDPAASGTSDSMTLKVNDGILALGSTTGLTFIGSSNGSASITVQGTLANLNAALNGLVYTPNKGFTGTDTLTISVSDAGDGLTGSASVLLSVAPKIGAGVVIGGTNLTPATTTTTSATTAPTTTTPATTTSSDTTATTDEEANQWAGMTAAVEVLNG